MPKLSQQFERGVTLAELCNLITDGKHGDCTPDETSGYYFLSCKDVRDGKLFYEGARQITVTDFVDTHRRTRLEPGDILITNSGTIGRMAIAPDVPLTRKTTFQKSVAIVKADAKKVDRKWLYYYLLAEADRLIGVAGGTAQKNLLLRDMRSFLVDLPDRRAQVRMACILSAYDDLIDNNTRRIAILEEMARLIYEEWFLRFRFPGYERVELFESELGDIPVGWKPSSILDVCSFVKGVEPGRGAYHQSPGDGLVPFLRVGDLSKRSSAIFVDRSITRGNTLEEKDVAISLDGTIGVVRYGLSGAYSGGIRKVVPIERHCGRAFLYQYLRSDYAQDVIRAHANGATILHAGSSIQHLKIAVPPAKLLRAFEGVADPMMQEVLLLEKTNSVLRATRDLLMAKLISGELDVSTLSELEAVAA